MPTYLSWSKIFGVDQETQVPNVAVNAITHPENKTEEAQPELAEDQGPMAQETTDNPNGNIEDVLDIVPSGSIAGAA
jgi:hypothetical protein